MLEPQTLFKPFTKSEIWTEVSPSAFISSLCFAINNFPSDVIIDLPLSALKLSLTKSLGFSLFLCAIRANVLALDWLLFSTFCLRFGLGVIMMGIWDA